MTLTCIGDRQITHVGWVRLLPVVDFSRELAISLPRWDSSSLKLSFPASTSCADFRDAVSGQLIHPATVI
jgi:hypothetical protein